MKYEKASVDVISFDDNAEFMVYSGGSAGQAAAEQAALASQAVAAGIAEVGGQAYAEVASSVYDPLTGQWTITVNINNKGGHTKKVVIVVE